MRIGIIHTQPVSYRLNLNQFLTERQRTRLVRALMDGRLIEWEKRDDRWIVTDRNELHRNCLISADPITSDLICELLERGDGIVQLSTASYYDENDPVNMHINLRLGPDFYFIFPSAGDYLPVLTQMALDRNVPYGIINPT